MENKQVYIQRNGYFFMRIPSDHQKKLSTDKKAFTLFPISGMYL